MWKDFKAFAFKGNVIDLAVAVIIGGAFGKIVASLVNDLIMPLIGLLTGGMNFANMFVVLKEVPAGTTVTTIEEAVAANIPTLNYGMFITHVIDFVIIAFVIFMMIRAMSKAKERLTPRKEAVAEEPVTKVCPYCKTAVDIAATRCPACTSNLE